MSTSDMITVSQKFSDHAIVLASNMEGIAVQAGALSIQSNQAGTNEFWYLFTIFVLAVFVGFYVVWSVTPALHSPLMAVTNAVSSVIIVGALIATGLDGVSASKILGFCGVVLASVNIFGGFIVTQRMLAMYKKKEK
jgi:NAD(P) transhydrogenase subunit alpha